MPQPKASSAPPEAESFENEALALEREVIAWTQSTHLSQPGAVPGYGDLTAALTVSSELCRRMAADPGNTPGETRYLEGVDSRIGKIIADLEDHADS